MLAAHRPASVTAAQARAAEDAGFEGCFSVQLHSEAAALAQGASAGRPDPALVSDDTARAFVVCGTPGEVAATLDGLVGESGVADSLTLRPPPVADREALAAYEARIAELF